MLLRRHLPCAPLTTCARPSVCARLPPCQLRRCATPEVQQLRNCVHKRVVRDDAHGLLLAHARAPGCHSASPDSAFAREETLDISADAG